MHDLDTDVVVIGAGFAGVTAARELTQRGVEVIVVEARDRLGGRTWTKESELGHYLELGGTWVHWTQPHVWAEIDRYGLDIYASAVPQRALWKKNGELIEGSPEEMFGLLDDGMTRLLARSAELFPNPFRFRPVTDELKSLDHVTIDEAIAALDLNPEQRDLVEGMWSLNFSGYPKNGALTQALRWCALTGGNWNLMFEACGTYKIVGGTKVLLDAIAGQSTADFRFDTRVQRVTQDADGATVVLTDGSTIRAREVIVTVPLNVLDDIEFEPALPSDLVSVSREGQTSQGIKVWARVKGEVAPVCAIGSSDSVLNFFLPEMTVDGDTLVVAFGPDASRLDITDRNAVQEALREWLPDVEVLAVDGHDWIADDLARQTWSMLRPNQLQTIQDAAAGPHGHVRLAGGDYAEGWAGFIDGAIESGKIAAVRVYETVRSSS